jgi:hypothetical protein
MNPMGRVSLLARGLVVGIQDRIDEILDRPQPGTGPFRLLPLLRQRTLQRFPHHPPVHAKLAATPRIMPSLGSYSRLIISTFTLQSTAASVLAFAHDELVGSTFKVVPNQVDKITPARNRSMGSPLG